MSKVQITISDVLADLANGLTRTSKSPSYDAAKGSIQDKYGLSGVEVKQLFNHPKLKNKKVHSVKEVGFDLIDDTETTTVALVEVEEIISDDGKVIVEEEVIAGEVVTEEKGW